ncbi:MAG: Fur family transcriptional regulator [bacterium]|jgi:Fur family zinc uptake transcriptional regulator
MPSHDPTAFPDEVHDHQACVTQLLDHAEQACAHQGARLTEQRRNVLKIVAGSHVPLGAYDILERLELPSRRKAPITVYRALDFLIEQGLVHRLVSLNAFIACFHAGLEHATQFLICRECRKVAELKSERVQEVIAQDASKAGFQVDHQTVEVSGICSSCV